MSESNKKPESQHIADATKKDEKPVDSKKDKGKKDPKAPKEEELVKKPL